MLLKDFELLQINKNYISNLQDKDPQALVALSLQLASDLKEARDVYPDRPDTCRTFPFEQGMLYDARQKKNTPVYFFRRTSAAFCRSNGTCLSSRPRKPANTSPVRFP